MTKLAICRKCHKVFFTNLPKRHPHLKCPQKNCRSRKVTLWSAKLINKLGYKVLYDLFPKERPEKVTKPEPEKKEPKIARKHKSEPKKKEPKVAGRRKLQLKSGHIEYFHQRYWEYKENQRMLMEPDRDPPHHVVRQWLMDTGTSKDVADRWAMELLEKYKPKE